MIRRTAKRLRVAFTLIELLIVVAIIAILAAIAVPNFLEAQTRSKVSRMRSDMRSMATALEAYRIDSNRYPLPVAVMNGSLAVVWPMPAANHNLYDHNLLPSGITTPIAYISTNITDVFADPAKVPTPEQQMIYYNSWEYTQILADQAGTPMMAPMQNLADQLGAWVMSSCGPDLDRKDISPMIVGTTTVNGIYEPTNGTVSNGDIFRSQKNPQGVSLR